MIRFTLRQFRSQAAIGIGALVVLGIVLLVTGPHLVHLYDTTVADCAKYNDCQSATNSFLNNDHALQIALNVLIVVVPGLIGLFWGAPLIARELEAGTYRLAWTQSASRSRWLAAKLLVVGLASMATTGLLSLLVTWWFSPIDRVNTTLFSTFDQRGIVPIGYAAFAFALGVAAGVLVRRTVPAMATMLGLFAAARLAINHWIRPNLLSPWRLTSAMNATSFGGFGRMNGGPLMLFPNPPNLPNAWIYSTQFVNRAGTALTSQVLTSACPQLANLGPPGGGGAVSVQRSAVPTPGGIQAAAQSCMTKLGKTYHVLTTYQPASHYWPMQWIELGIYLAVALVLADLSYWWIRHRIA